MTAPTGRQKPARQRLAALVQQRRVALGWSKETTAATCGLAYMTYDRVENGESVQARTLARLEKGLGFGPGTFRAVLEGATSVMLEDGTEMQVIEIAAVPPEDIEDQVRGAMHNAMVAGTDLDADKIRNAAELAIQILRKGGVLPPAGDAN